jgi:Na+/H+ antiporter NhaC
MWYTVSKSYLVYLIVAIVVYYFLSRYYLSNNNYIQKENADAKLNWYSHRLNNKIILYVLIPLLFYIITQIFFKK